MDSDSSPAIGPLQQRASELEAALRRSAALFREIPVVDALILRLLMLLGRDITALLERTLRPHGLNESDYRTLMVLVSQPDGVAHPSDLCADVAQSPANMTRIADALQERDLITRVPSEEDRRRTILRITPAGEALVRALLPDVTDRIRAIFDGTSSSGREALLGQLRALITRLDRCADQGGGPTTAAPPAAGTPAATPHAAPAAGTQADG